MRLSALTIRMMINTTEDWIEHDEIREQLLALGPLGVGMFEELVAANEHLVELAQRHTELREALRVLIKLCQQLDSVHDRKARGLCYALDGLIEVSEDPAQIARLEQLKAQLFPAGLRVVRLPYVEEGGAARQLEQAIGPEIRAQLAAVPFGDQDLEQVLDAWLEAGRKLGRATNQRARVEASLQRKHDDGAKAVDLRVGRNRWMQAVRGLLWALETKPELEPIVAPVESTLRNAIAVADRRRASRAIVASGAVEAAEAGAVEPVEAEDSAELPLDDDAQEQLLAQIEAEFGEEELPGEDAGAGEDADEDAA